MNKQVLMIPAAVAATIALALPAHAAFVADASGFTVVEDFESFDGLVTQGPAALGGGIEVVSSIQSTLGAFAVDLGDNGTWGAGNNFAGIGDLSFSPSSFEYDGSMTFSWNEGRTGVGALFSIYQVPGGTEELLLEALSSTGAVLESSSVLFNLGDPSLHGAASFFGFLRSTNDVYGLRVSGDGFVLDDVSVAPVPLPAALPLLLGGIALVGAAGRRRRRV